MKWRKRAGSARKRGSKLDDVRDAGRRILLRILLLLLFPRNHRNFVEATMYNVDSMLANSYLCPFIIEKKSDREISEIVNYWLIKSEKVDRC